MDEHEAMLTLRERLAGLGEVEHTLYGASQGDGPPEHDYVREVGVTAEDVPALIEMAGEWMEDVEGDYDELSDEEEAEVWLPLHAWRALGQLGSAAAEAVGAAVGDA